MGLYEGIKDVANVVQKADNIDLYRQLLDLGAQALDMQAEIARLQNENKCLREDIDKKQNVIRHKGAFITLKDDEQEIPYCAICYAQNGALMQLYHHNSECYRCYNCRKYIRKEG